MPTSLGRLDGPHRLRTKAARVRADGHPTRRRRRPTAADEPRAARRRAGDASYRGGPAPWDIEEPQAAVPRLAAEGAFTGAVLDAGCGTGDNALHLAAVGCGPGRRRGGDGGGDRAREGASRGLDAEFLVADALHLDRLGRVFDTVLDCGLLHTFDGDERRDVRGEPRVGDAPRRNGAVLCFSDVDPEAAGPHPIAEDELRAAFGPGSGWRVVSVDPDRLRTRFAPQGVPAGWRGSCAPDRPRSPPESAPRRL